MFHPEVLQNETLHVFSKDVCRSLPFEFEKEIDLNGIPGYRWIDFKRFLFLYIKWFKGTCKLECHKQIFYFIILDLYLPKTFSPNQQKIHTTSVSMTRMNHTLHRMDYSMYQSANMTPHYLFHGPIFIK